MKNCDILNSELIAQKLNVNANITILETVDSTNRYLKSISDQNTPEFTVIISENQTAGRGRFSRKFYSPENCGIYMSILLNPNFNIEDSVLLTAATAVAVSDAIENISGKEAKIKWVNDVLIDSKKVCGILCEGVINPKNAKLERVILGIGINAYKPENGFSEEIRDIATYIYETPETDKRNNLIADIINNLKNYYTELKSRTFLEKYRSRSVVIGNKISVLKNDDVIPATALSIDDNCRLEVEYADKTREFLSSGEISIRLN